MHRLILAFRCFFGILFHGRLSDEVITELGIKPVAAAAPASPAAAPPPARTSDGALQMLAILQRDSRLVDFLMEDIGGYTDDQIGAAVRQLHGQARETLSRYVTLQPVIDGVEGTFTKAPSKDPAVVKFVGNVPAAPPDGGTLRHKGWRASRVDLPAAATRNAEVIAPAEIEIE